MMTQKENQKFADDFAFDFNNNFDELKKRLDDCAVALTFDTLEEYEVFRDECNRLKELEQSQIKQITELQKQLEEKAKEIERLQNELEQLQHKKDKRTFEWLEDLSLDEKVQVMKRVQKNAYEKLSSGNFWYKLRELSREELLSVVYAVIDEQTYKNDWVELDYRECWEEQEYFILEALESRLGGDDNE